MQSDAQALQLHSCSCSDRPPFGLPPVIAAVHPPVRLHSTPRPCTAAAVSVPVPVFRGWVADPLLLAALSPPPRPPLQDSSPEYSRYCACDAGWGSWGCQLQLLSLPLNTGEPVTATIPPGKWGYWEVSLPAWQAPSGLGAAADMAAAGRGGGGGSSGSNEQLLLMAERVPGPGFGGNPLLFLKPFDNKVRHSRVGWFNRDRGLRVEGLCVAGRDGV